MTLRLAGLMLACLSVLHAVLPGQSIPEDVLWHFVAGG
jgi:hypothetical protein